MSKYLEPYQRAIKQFGPGFWATLWRNPGKQQLRWDVFMDMVDHRILGHHTVMDVGSGDGSFLEFFREHMGNIAYIGIDGIPEQVQLAKSRDIENAEWHCVDFMDDPAVLRCPHNWALISGTLNNMEQDVAMDLLIKIWLTCENGMIFNFLCASTEWDGTYADGIITHDPIEWLKWARSLTRDVVYTQEYLHGADGTILMMK